jgi:glycosyltransferase involved in cell wall biosynthesis
MLRPPIPVTMLVDHVIPGGAERHAVTLANSLDRSRFAVSFLRLKPGGGLEDLLDRDRLTASNCADVARRLDFAAARRVGAHLDATGCRVVVAANPYATLYALLGRARSRCQPRVVSTYHTTVLQDLKSRLQMVLYTVAFRRVDSLVYVCENQRAYWRRRALRARSDTVIYNGVDVEHFPAEWPESDRATVRAGLNLPPDGYVVGICAALRPEKAHGDFLSGIARLRAHGVDAWGIVIGDGPERARVEREIDRLALRRVVRVTGAQLDVRPFVAACDVMALTSRTETFSISTLESLAMGRPVVMTNTGGAPEQIEDGVNGFLYRSGDVETLTDYLARLASPTLRAQMGAAAARGVRERFPLSRMVAEYSALIERLA